MYIYSNLKSFINVEDFLFYLKNNVYLCNMIKFRHKQEYRRFAVTVMKQMRVEIVRPATEVYGSKYTTAHVTRRVDASLIRELPSFETFEIKISINETADIETIKKYVYTKYNSNYQLVSWTEITYINN